MKMELKPALILLVTLGLGVVLGLVGRGQLTRERDRRVAELRTAPGFESLVQEVIEPRAEQVDSIRPILAASAHRYDSLVSGARVGLGLVLDSMKLKLAPLLDAQQRERLARMTTLPDANRRPPPGERPREEGGPQGNPPRAGGQRQDNPPPREGGPGGQQQNNPPRPGGPGGQQQGNPRPRPGDQPQGGRPPANRPGGPPPDRPPPPPK